MFATHTSRVRCPEELLLPEGRVVGFRRPMCFENASKVILAKFNNVEMTAMAGCGGMPQSERAAGRGWHW